MPHFLKRYYATFLSPLFIFFILSNETKTEQIISSYISSYMYIDSIYMYLHFYIFFFFTIYSVGDKCNVQLTYIHRWKIGVKHEQINRKKRTRANETQKKRFGLEMVLAKLAAVRDTLSINNIGRREKTNENGTLV